MYEFFFCIEMHDEWRNKRNIFMYNRLDKFGVPLMIACFNTYYPNVVTRGRRVLHSAQLHILDGQAFVLRTLTWYLVTRLLNWSYILFLFNWLYNRADGLGEKKNARVCVFRYLYVKVVWYMVVLVKWDTKGHAMHFYVQLYENTRFRISKSNHSYVYFFVWKIKTPFARHGRPDLRIWAEKMYRCRLPCCFSRIFFQVWIIGEL